MFKDDPDVKPISIIITTIAAKAYSGQASIELALAEILDGLKRFANSGSSFVPNPVNPEENFADRWAMPQYEHLHLRENFSSWVTQARTDFSTMMSTSDMSFLSEQALKNFQFGLLPVI